MTDDTEYRIEGLRHRLAHGELAELGLRIEARAGTVAVSGTVADDACRETVLAVIAEELSGLTVHVDVTIAATEAPTRAEQI
jgi:hypothetical protein